MLLELSMMLLPQAGTAQDLFTVYRGSEGRVEVSANKRVTAMTALQVLSTKLRWEMLPASTTVGDVLRSTSLELSFKRQPARTVAHLIAVAAGLDVVFDDSQEVVRLHVTHTPDPDSVGGRERLRHWAIHWYEQFLADDPTIQNSRAVQDQGTDALMHLGELLMRANALEEAADVYDRVAKAQRDSEHWYEARLRLAEARFEISQLNRLGPAERETWLSQAKEISGLLAAEDVRLPQARAAVVLHGRILMHDDQLQRAIKFLEAHALRLATQPESIDAQLLLSSGYIAYGEPLKALQLLNLLYENRSLTIKFWSQEQKLDYFYYRGAAAEALGREEIERQQQKFKRAVATLPAGSQQLPEIETETSDQLLQDAMQSLELFLIGAVDDFRRAQAFVLLGRTYMHLGRFIEARSAAVESLLQKGKLDLEWRQDARILEAQTGLALGDRDAALDKLRGEVLRNPESMPKLVIFLVEAFAEAGQFQRAISTADLLEDLRSEWGDRARFARIKVMARQRRADKLLSVFPAEATAVAMKIRDRKLQGQAAELIGQAYEELGQLEKALDAYNGRLR